MTCGFPETFCSTSTSLVLISSHVSSKDDIKYFVFDAWRDLKSQHAGPNSGNCVLQAENPNVENGRHCKCLIVFSCLGCISNIYRAPTHLQRQIPCRWRYPRFPFTDHQGHANTSSPPSSPVPLQEANRRMKSSCILAEVAQGSQQSDQKLDAKCLPSNGR